MLMWCATHKRLHPFGVACTMCTEDVFDAAVVGSDPEASTGAIQRHAGKMAASYAVAAVRAQEYPVHYRGS